MPDSCCAILIAPIWPIISIALGLIGGTISSAIGTLIVFLVALAHFPFQLCQTLAVAATTNECLKDNIQGNLWRVPVLLLSPIGPISFLLVSIFIRATCGTLAQIGYATGVVYNHDYSKARENMTSNLKFEKDSTLGGFLDTCSEVVNEDEFAIATIQCIKMLLTAAFALFFACLAFIPFAMAMAAITVFRLPINFFKTMKIILFTVVLRWDLRIIALLMLPLIHTLFPMVVLVVSMVGCFFWTWAQTQENLYEDHSPFREWGQLVGTVKDYYEEHKKFVSKRCDPFDHPTGIPMGWNGQQYGLEIERIVRFQLNFLLCVALLLYQTPIILIGTGAIVLIKYIPVCLFVWTCTVIGADDNGEESGGQRSSSSRETLNADAYWDRFASQCIQSTVELLANGFLDFDSIEGMDPSCVQSIPSVAVFAILMDSLQKEGLNHGDIYWKVDDTVCAAKVRPQLDNIAALLWPMVLDLQNFLKKHKKTLQRQEEDQQQTMSMQALLCDNHDSDESTDAIRKVLDETSEKQKALNNQIRAKISRLVLAILRVRPFQERMEKIFEHKYEKPKKTLDDLEAQPIVDKVDPNKEETVPENIRGMFWNLLWGDW